MRDLKIYLDYIFFENLFVNIIISLLINNFTKNTFKKTNLLLGTIFISFYTTIIYVLEDSFINCFFIKIIAVTIYIYITFKPKTIIKLLKNTIYYYLFLFTYVGIIIFISLMFDIDLENSYIKISIYSISSILLYIFINNLWKMWKSNIKNNDLIYNIDIKGNEFVGFVDTGHNVKDMLTNLDVIFIDYKYKEILNKYINEKKKITINISTLNNNISKVGYIFNDIYIYKNKKNIVKIKKIVISFVKDSFVNEKYNALIGYNIYINNLKGVTFC